MKTLVGRIRKSFEDIINQFIKMMYEIPINYFERESRYAIVFAPEFYWGELTPSQINLQTELLSRYNTMFEILRLIFSKASNDINDRLKEADTQFRMWLQLESNYVLKDDRQENEKNFKEDANKLEQIINILEGSKKKRLILIPDTNSLLRSSDPVKYRDIVKVKSFLFILLPTVLSELDKLKINHRSQSVIEKSKKAIKRIKGWRTQGPLLSGVTVHKTITVQTIANEPNMESTLSWLDKENQDDRIIASVLEIQTLFPASRIILVTGDINLQNKAEMAMIEYNEL